MAEATIDLSTLGYTSAMQLMRLGQLRMTQLWRPEAFEQFRSAMVDGTPSTPWISQFNQDLRRTLGDDHLACFVLPNQEGYPAEQIAKMDGPAAAVRVSFGRGMQRRQLTFIIRPEAEHALEAIVRTRFSGGM